MITPRILLVAAAATMLTTAGFAAAPTADQVSVPPGQEQHHHNKLQTLFSSPDQMVMFRVEMHDATRGMPRDQKRAWRKAEIQKIRSMNGQERDAFLQDLQTKWNALPADRKAHIEHHLEMFAARHEQRRAYRNGQYNNGQTPPPPAPQQQQQ
jgi:hypothetical protein